MATGIVNAGGSFGQFVFAPLAAGISAAAGWITAVQALGLITLFALPAAWVLRGASTPPATTATPTAAAEPSLPATTVTAPPADAPQPGTFEPVDNPATTEPLPATP
jgi:hypothetical protein